jgi:hypothetical protein
LKSLSWNCVAVLSGIARVSTVTGRDSLAGREDIRVTVAMLFE